MQVAVTSCTFLQTDISPDLVAVQSLRYDEESTGDDDDEADMEDDPGEFTLPYVEVENVASCMFPRICQKQEATSEI